MCKISRLKWTFTIWVFLFISFGIKVGFSQIKFEKSLSIYDVVRYGKTAAEPFHSAKDIHLDTMGRIVFQSGNLNYRYNGSSFEETGKNTFDGTTFRDASIPYLQWHTTKSNLLIREQKGILDTFDLSAYIAIGTITDIQKKQNQYLVLSNYNLLYFDEIDGDLQFTDSIALEGVDANAMFLKGDTIFLRPLDKRPCYLLESDPFQIHYYGDRKLSDFKTKIFYLPGQRMILRNPDKWIFVDQNSPYYRALSLLENKDINEHLIDRSGNLWVATRSMGIIKFDPNTEAWENFNKDNLLTFYNGIFEDPYGSIWIGAGGEGLFQIYKPLFQVLNKKQGLSHGNIWSITSDTKGNIYFTTNCNGVDVVNTANKIENNFLTGCIKNVLENKDGGLWVSTEGISLLNKDGLKNYQKEAGLHSRSPSAALIDQKGDLWIGTRQAIHRFEKDRFINT